jgi:hypothetical protein
MKQMTITCGACGASQHITPGELAYTCTECQAPSRYLRNARTWVWDPVPAIETRPAAKHGAVWWLTVVLFVIGIVAVFALLGIW